MMLLLWVSVLVVVPPSFAALHASSPCPNIFSYEGSQPDRDRWYGSLLLSTDESLVGVRIDVKLDRTAEILVSWMGKVTTEDNARFTILSLDQSLNPGPAISSRFMVRFNPSRGSPQVETIRLNGRQICPPDPNYSSDVQPSNNVNHLYENQYTTERVSRRPDLDFGEDSGNSRPQPQPQPSRRPTGGYSSGERDHGYSSHEVSNTGRNPSTGTGYHNHGTQTDAETFNSHESYNNDKNHRDLNHTRPSGLPSPLGTDYTPPGSLARPSISININKDVTYNVDRPDTVPVSYHPESPRPGSSGSTHPDSHSQHPTATEHSGNRQTTKKPVVINSININIHTDDEVQNTGSRYTTSTRRPATSNNKNNTSHNNNHPSPQRPPAPITQRPSTNNGNQNPRPSRNPGVTSSETQQTGQNSYENSDKTTERNYNSKGQTSFRPSGSGYNDNSRPSAVPNSRPSGEGNKNIPRPDINSGSKPGVKGDLDAANSNVKCGRVEVNAAPLITHGQNTARGQWPWHIALYRIEGINLSYSCGGSLITSTVVITAAHCVTKAPRDRPVDADILVVQLGKYHLYQFSDDSVQNKQVRDVHVHPRYNSSNYLDDLALLVLTSPAEFTKFVRPVCLWPKHNFNLPSINNKEGTVVGWGYDENNQVTEELKMARMPVVSYVTCLKSYPQFFSQFTAENKTFCAGFRQGTSVCNGDSGGGMVFQQDNVWYLRGLVSITVAKQGLRVCDTNHYVVFTDIANYIDWINRYI